MTLRRWAVLLGVCVSSLFGPREASAGLLGWLEQLSGPGPFKGRLIASLPVYCVPVDRPGLLRTKTNDLLACGYDALDVKFYVEAEAGWWSMGPREEFKGNVYLRTYEVIAYKPLRDVFCPSYLKAVGNALDVGAGVGALNFTGAAVPGSHSHDLQVAFPLRVRLTPAQLLPPGCFKNPNVQRLLGAVYLTAGIELMPGRPTFRTNDGTPDGSTASFGHESLRSARVVFDVGRLARGVAGLVHP